MMAGTKLLKVCGMRRADNIRAVEALGIDMMGFIFWPGSSRYVGNRPSYLPTRCRRVGVFVDEDIDRLLTTARAYALDSIQLHGHETPEYCALVEGYHVIKAFSIATDADLAQTEAYAGVCHSFLFDTKGQAVGGNGSKFDWAVLEAYDGATPFLLSGGIGPTDAPLVDTFCHPRCIGIDVNSRFELAPGVKDVDALRTFITQLRHHDVNM